MVKQKMRMPLARRPFHQRSGMIQFTASVLQARRTNGEHCAALSEMGSVRWPQRHRGRVSQPDRRPGMSCRPLAQLAATAKDDWN
jgi:hypothetical protein